MLDIGIVVASYNTRDLLMSCLRSVYASTGSVTFEVCVVDDASSDGSAEVVSREFPQAHLVVSTTNQGYAATNNEGLRSFGFGHAPQPDADAPRYALLLNSDTELPPTALDRMVARADARPDVGITGPKVLLPDGKLDLACRRSFPTPEVAFYRLVGLSRLWPASRRFGRYNCTYLDPNEEAEVDSVMGAFMLVRAEAIAQAGLLDTRFFMYGEDLDWAYRIKNAGWRVLYDPGVEIMHVKRAAARKSPRAQVEFYRAMDLFYRKHYASSTPRILHLLITWAIALRTRIERIRVSLAARREDRRSGTEV
jgi:GT2 family glycosyltransferase